MQIHLNGHPREIPENTTVANLLQLEAVKPPYAVEINHRVCPKATHHQTTLAPNDTVEIVTIVGGG